MNSFFIFTFLSASSTLTPSVKTRYVSKNVLRKSIDRKRRSVSLSNSRSGLAYLIWGSLQELRVRLKRMSTSSLNRRESFLIEWGIVIEDASLRVPWNRSLKCTLSMHWNNKQKKKKQTTSITNPSQIERRCNDNNDNNNDNSSNNNRSCK